MRRPRQSDTRNLKAASKETHAHASFFCKHTHTPTPTAVRLSSQVITQGRSISIGEDVRMLRNIDTHRMFTIKQSVGFSVEFEEDLLSGGRWVLDMSQARGAATFDSLPPCGCKRTAQSQENLQPPPQPQIHIQRYLQTIFLQNKGGFFHTQMGKYTIIKYD